MLLYPDPCDVSVVNHPDYLIPDSAISATTTHAHCPYLRARMFDYGDGNYAWCTGMLAVLGSHKYDNTD